ncbi:MAG: UTP--glucose-1-phosphate uridylyltransferase GalU [Acidimicrobiales bacterium]
MAEPNRVTKAVIPAAGLGTRFLPLTKAQPKEMVPVVDRPAIQYVVEEAVRAGIDDILIITGRTKRSVEDHFDRHVELELELEKRGKHADLDLVRSLADLADIHYVRQAEPLGLGHAVGVARKHVGDHPFAVMLPDDVMVDDSALLSGMIAAFDERQRSVLALMEVEGDAISHYGSAAVDASAGAGVGVVRVLGVVEKPRPEDAPSNLAVIGRYVFTPEIFDAIERVKPGVGSEIQLTDAVALLLETQEVYGFRFSDGRYDTGNKLDWLVATVELAAARDDLGPDFLAFLRDFVARLDP